MAEAVQANGRRILIGNRPANVIMATDVVHPRHVGGGDGHFLERMGGQHDIFLGQHAPQQDHQAVVVGQLALLARHAPCAKVGHYILGRDNRLRLEDDAGAGDLGEGAKRLQDGVRLGQVFAVGSHLLPHKRHCIHAKHLYPLIGQIEDDVEHFAKDGRVAIVQIPLVIVERGPHPCARLAIDGNFGVVGKVAGGCFGEDVAQGTAVLVGQGAIGEEEVVFLVGGVASFGLHGPFVFFGRVVAHNVGAKADAVLAQGTAEFGQVGHCAEPFVYTAVILHSVTAIIGARAGLQEGHQVQVGHTQLFKVGDFFGYSFEVARKFVHIANVANRFRALEPIGLVGVLQVEQAQVGGALGVGGGELANEALHPVVEVGATAVELLQGVGCFGQVLCQPQIKDLFFEFGEFFEGFGEIHGEFRVIRYWLLVIGKLARTYPVSILPLSFLKMNAEKGAHHANQHILSPV